MYLCSKIPIHPAYNPFAGLDEECFVFFQERHTKSIHGTVEAGEWHDADSFASHEFVGEVLVHAEIVMFHRVEVEPDFLGRGGELLAFERVRNRSE